ncbi:MAG: threonine aldolase [Hyphomicrobiaceae bacterium]|jgi:threonine aldolase
MTSSTLDRVALANNPAICDLRSDTVTRPDQAMRDAMSNAPVGDDVYGDDPTVAALETFATEMLGKQEAAFFPSGTQSNLAAMLSHCQRGDELITGTEYHVKSSEGAGASVLGGVAIHTIAAEPDGSLAPDAISAAIKPDDAHHPVSRLLCLENTHKGAVISLAAMQAASAAARDKGLAVHLDGARLFNATQALGIEPAALAATADTVSLCLSKGLGTPAGTLLLGPKDVLHRARRWRKILGGGMRQSGILAAAAMHALQHNVSRLSDDHQRAATLSQHLIDIGAGDPAHPTRSETCMVFFTPAGDHMAFRASMAEQGVLLGGNSPTIRLVLHKDIDDAKLDRICSAFSAQCGT